MNTLRERAYWLVDRVRHGGIMRREVRALEIADSLDSHEACQDSELRRQLDFVVCSVPYYAFLDPGATLEEFPVMNKGSVRAAGDSMLTQVAREGKTHVASTSGSTGMPFRVHHDAAKRRRIAAEAVFWGRLAGYDVGVPLYHLKVWSGRNKIGRMTQLLRNIRPVDVLETDAGDNADLLWSLAVGKRRSSVISYGSALEAAARILESRTHREPREARALASIVSQSEPMSERARETLSTHLGVMPMARYGLEELGIVAQQVPGSAGWYRVAPSSFFIEILSESSDRPVAPGGIGRIVITDLVNRAQPLVRYDTGDLGRFATENGVEDRRWLAEVRGRQADQLYDSLDRPLPVMMMYRIWWKYPSILQYQVVQHGRANYELRLNVAGAALPQQAVIDDFLGIVGNDAVVGLTFTDENFVLNSGKRKALVSHYRPSNPNNDQEPRSERQ